MACHKGNKCLIHIWWKYSQPNVCIYLFHKLSMIYFCGYERLEWINHWLLFCIFPSPCLDAPFLLLNIILYQYTSPWQLASFWWRQNNDGHPIETECFLRRSLISVNFCKVFYKRDKANCYSIYIFKFSTILWWPHHSDCCHFYSISFDSCPWENMKNILQLLGIGICPDLTQLPFPRALGAWHADWLHILEQ